MSLMHRKRNHVAMDRISNLPCNVIDDILKYLPMCDAVRTSILSRGWRYKWLTIPYLVFDMNSEGSGISCIGYNVDSVIYQVLVQHKGPLVKFIWYVLNGIGRPALDHCLNFLSNHRIEELTLRFFWERTPQTMPHHLFTFDLLTHLHLINCELRPPLSFKGFDRLVKLDLDRVLIEPEMFIRFMSRFPMLEHLTLNNVLLNVPDLEIDAPNLKSFCFIFGGNFPSICFKSTSLLEVVSITSYTVEIREGCRYNLIEFCGQLSSIKKLKLEGGSLLQLLARGVPQKLLNNLGNLTNLQCQINFASRAEVSSVLCLIRSSPNLQILDINFCKGAAVQEQSKGPKSYFIEFFNSLSSIKKLNLKCDYLVFSAGFGILHELPTNLSHLMVLQFSCIDFAIVAEVSCVLCWLRSSPSLQNLEITSRTHRNSDMKPAVQFIKEQQKLKLTLGHLENVKINSFSGSRPEKEFLKLVLLSATSLTKVKLQFHSTIKPATERESRILKQLARLC